MGAHAALQPSEAVGFAATIKRGILGGRCREQVPNYARWQTPLTRR